MVYPRSIFLLGATCSLFLLIGCTTVPILEKKDHPPSDKDVKDIPDAIPQDEPLSKYGNPASYVVHGKRYVIMKNPDDYHARGLASWYGMKFHGKRTSSGEPYDVYGMTAAHPTLPIPSYVSVKNVNNGTQVVVKVNDRGPFHADRIIDLSYAAAKKLGILSKGTALVEVDALKIAGNTRSTTQKTPSSKKSPQIYVQVGSFSDPKSAQKVATKLQAAFTEPVNVKVNTRHAKKNSHRVRIGPIVSTQKISDIMLKLKAHSMPHFSASAAPIVIIE